jgi:SAM-dependent methyltransferase
MTMDIDPAAAAHGSSQRHVTACASRASEHFGAESLDLIVFNGVFGWGLDERAQVEAAVEGFARVLRPGGELIVGWNRIGRHRPFEFSQVQALAAFERVAFAPLGRAIVDVPGSNRHRFEFFARPTDKDAR